MVMRCESCVACIQMNRKRRRRPDAREEPDLRLIVHPTAKVLSQSMAAWLFTSLDVRHSSASQLRTSSASSILFMIKVIALNISFTLSGHYFYQMIGPILFRPDV